jgi:hypothetical protein
MSTNVPDAPPARTSPQSRGSLGNQPFAWRASNLRQSGCFGRSPFYCSLAPTQPPPSHPRDAQGRVSRGTTIQWGEPWESESDMYLISGGMCHTASHEERGKGGCDGGASHTDIR